SGRSRQPAAPAGRTRASAPPAAASPAPAARPGSDGTRTMSSEPHSGRDPICVLAEHEDSDSAREAAQSLGLRLPLSDARAHRRPGVTVTDEQTGLVRRLREAWRRRRPRLVYVHGVGLRAVGQAAALEPVRRVRADPPGDARTTLVATVLAVARHCGDVLDQIDYDSQELGTRA